MSSISSPAAFYQFFRDRETGATSQHPQVGEHPRNITPGDVVGQDNSEGPIDETGSASPVALTPSQVRDRLDTLIAGQVATGKLSNEQGAALLLALGPKGGQDASASAALVDSHTPRNQETDAQGWRDSGAVLATFIQNLQVSQPSGANYGSDGSAPTRNFGSHLLDFNT